MVEPTTLTTQRLVLRPFTLADADDVFAYASDEEWGRYLPVPHPYARRDADGFVARSVLREWDRGAVFAITAGGIVVGGMNLTVDSAHAVAKLGYSLARPYWGQGLTTEAARAVAAWGFETFGLAKITAMADARNVGSWRVMEKLGMKREGYFRGHRLHRGERVDEVRYGLLREDFAG